MKRIYYFLVLTFLAVSAVSIVSCKDDDDDSELYGNWLPMEWESNGDVVKEKGVYIIAAKGESVSFTCKNYSLAWIGDALVDGSYITPDYSQQCMFLQGGWFEAKMSGNVLTVVFSKNDTLGERVVSLRVTGGDIIYDFCFKQLADNKIVDKTI